jgi:hypothetical protein
MPVSYEEVLKFEGVGEKIALLYSGVALNEVEIFYIQISGKE